MNFAKFACCAIAAIGAFAAETGATTIDPDYRPDGTATTEGQQIQTLYSSLGVTFQSFIMGSGLSNRLYAVTPYNGGSAYQGRASTGTKVFSYYPYGWPYDDVWESDTRSGSGGTNTGDRLYINFTNPVSYVALDFLPLKPGATYTNVNGTRPIHEGLLYVYSGSTLLKTIVVSNADPIERASVVGSNITRVIATARGWPSLYFPPGYVLLDNLTFAGGGSVGTIDLGGGALDTLYGYTLGSGDTLTGTGAVTGDLTNSGTLDPGSSPGKITINGTFTQTSQGTTIIDIAGAQASLIDLLDINGNALLDGNLQISLLDGFLPTDGQTFRILEYNTRSGAFASTSGLNFSGGHFELDFSATGLNLIARLDAEPPEPPTPGVPEPGTLALLGLGLAGLAASRRRRQ